MFRSPLFASVLLALIALSGCTKNDNPLQAEPVDLGQILARGTDIIIATYTTLDARAEMLVSAIGAFQENPTQASLAGARLAWQETRAPWESSEAFLFGPVETNGIDPSIDSWPVNTVDLDAVLAGTDSLTQSSIDGLEGTLKGFHTIEYLLFGANGDKQPGEFTERQLQYLLALAQSLKGETSQLLGAWSSSGDNFGANITHAGNPGSIYPSQKSALEELANGMVGIADEVANGKINDPFVQSDITLEESRFSANSKEDFQNNIRGILYLYTGTFENQNGPGIGEVIAYYDTDLDQRVRSTIQTAIDAIGAIPGTFTSAIFNDRQAVQAAQTAVRNVQHLFESEVLPLLDSRVQ